MIKRPFLTFIAVIGTLIAGLLWFIESPQFAQAVKAVASRYIPKDVGIDVDFSELSVKLFPPGFSVKSPSIRLDKQNIVRLPPGSSVVAERIDFNFRFFQIFSGDIRVHEITIVNGQVQLVLDKSMLTKKPTQPSRKRGFHWDELLQVRAEAVALQNVSVNVQFAGTTDSMAAKARILRLGQWSGQGGLGYSVYLDLENIQGKYFKQFSLPPSVDRVLMEAYLNVRGLQLESLMIQNQGVEVSASGHIKGNVLDARELSAEGILKASGNLKQLYSMAVPKASPKDAPEGSFQWVSKVQGNPLKISETLKADGSLKIQGLNFQKWKAESLEASAKFEADAETGGTLSLLKASIQSPEKPRVAENQPGEGGKIEIGPLTWTLGSQQSPVKIPIHFERAHVHWLGAPALKDVYGLDFRLSGDIPLVYVPPKKNQPWEIQANLKAWVDKFQLDNQRYLQKKPLSTVFQIPRIDLDGLVIVDPTGIRPMDLIVGLPHSKIHANGKVDFKSGYDLYANGTVLLDDFGQIAENDIRGQGTLTSRIHGPTKRVLVDIDVDFKDAYYLKLFLGAVRGRITWDDDPSKLLFSQAQVTHGTTTCIVNGGLDFGKPGSGAIDLGAQIPQGNIQDLIQIFDNLARPIWWFPRELNGPLAGRLDVKGGVGLSQLQVLAKLDGTNWEFAGERFKTVHVVGGYDKGRYALDEFHTLKRFGRVEGTIAYGVDRKLEWDFRSFGLNVSDLDHIAQLDVPIRGKLAFQSSGEGTEGAIQSYSQFDLQDFTVRGSVMAPSQMTLKTKKGAVHLQGSILGGEGTFDSVYDFNPKELSYIHGEFKQLDFSPVLLLLNTRSIQDRALAGYISGSMDLNFHAGAADRANGTMTVSEYLLARTGARFQLTHPFSLKMVDGSFAVEGVGLQGQSDAVTLSLKSDKGKLEGSVGGELDNSIAEFFTSTVTQATGQSKLDFLIGGTLKEPSLFGRAHLGGGSVRVSSFESPFENVTGTLQLKQNVISVQNLQADLGGGRITTAGQIVINPDRYPDVYLKANVSGSKIKVYPLQFAKVNGTVGIEGKEPPYTINGHVMIEQGLSREKVLNQKKGVVGLKALQYAPPLTKQGESNYPKFKLNIDVDAPQGVLIQNDLFRDVQVKGNLTLVNTLDAPRILGTAEAIQGKLIFKDHLFQIQSASAHFDSPTVINPSFDLSATTEVNGIKIQLYANGRLPDKIKVEFTSNPAMQEAEILSLLAVGLTSHDAKKLNANDVNTIQQGEAASLVLHSLDFNRDLEDKTGFQVQLDESVNPQQGVSAFSPNAQAASVAAPQITIRRKLGDRVSLSAGSTVGAGSNRSNQVIIDYSVNPDVSLSGVFNNYGVNGNVDPQSTTQSTTQSTQNSFGLDLKFQKRFK